MSYQWICSTSTKRLPKESRSPYRNLLFVNVIITIWNMQMKLWWWLLHKEPHREVSKGKLKERTNCTKNTYVQNQKKTDLILDLQQRRRIKRFYRVQWRGDCREAWSSISWGRGGTAQRRGIRFKLEILPEQCGFIKEKTLEQEMSSLWSAS